MQTLARKGDYLLCFLSIHHRNEDSHEFVGSVTDFIESGCRKIYPGYPVAGSFYPYGSVYVEHFLSFFLSSQWSYLGILANIDSETRPRRRNQRDHRPER